MYLRSNRRTKNGKTHTYWSVVESQRLPSGRIVQRPVLYLGEINSSQKAAWRRTIEVLEKGPKGQRVRQMSLFSDEQAAPVDDDTIVQLRLGDVSVCRPRQYGACWLALKLWNLLNLDQFWRWRLPPSREGTNWLNLLKTMTAYTLISGGSEWKLHRRWFGNSAMGDLLNEDAGLVNKDNPYRCLDKLLEHKDELFRHLQKRWSELFDANYEVLLYDLTSTYFECDPPQEGIRRYGYSRDKRGDCVQVVIALIVTPKGLPVAFEVMPGNTADSTTLRHFLKKIETMYGKANRTWIMDRGIPTEETLAEMREAGVSYLVGTPKGRLTKLQKSFADKPWREAREQVEVKLHQEQDELYVLVKSEKRVSKEKAMRRRRLKAYWKALQKLQQRKRPPKRDQLLLAIGKAQSKAGRAASLVDLRLPKEGEPVNGETFQFTLNRDKLRARLRAEGLYLLRSNLVGEKPEKLWSHYMVLTQVEQAFKELKNDLAVRPVYHQRDDRIEAHIFVAFLAYCLQATLKNLLKKKASGLTPREVLEQLGEIQMVDVHLPTVDGQRIVLPRYTKPTQAHELILHMLEMKLPRQPMAYLASPQAEEGMSALSPQGAKLLREYGFGGQGKNPIAQPKGKKKKGKRRRAGPRGAKRGMYKTRQKCSGDFWTDRPEFATIRAPRPP